MEIAFFEVSPVYCKTPPSHHYLPIIVVQRVTYIKIISNSDFHIKRSTILSWV